MKENRTLHRDDVRNMCIRNNYFTCGTSAEYEEMFRFIHPVSANFRPNVTSAFLVKLARRIAEYSELGKDFTKEEGIANIASLLAKECRSFFE